MHMYERTECVFVSVFDLKTLHVSSIKVCHRSATHTVGLKVNRVWGMTERGHLAEVSSRRCTCIVAHTCEMKLAALFRIGLV